MFEKVVAAVAKKVAERPDDEFGDDVVDLNRKTKQGGKGCPC